MPSFKAAISFVAEKLDGHGERGALSDFITNLKQHMDRMEKVLNVPFFSGKQNTFMKVRLPFYGIENVRATRIAYPEFAKPLHHS